MPDYPVQGMQQGYVTVPAGSSASVGSVPPVGEWFDNSSQQPSEVVSIPANGEYWFNKLSLPTKGDRRIVVVSQFCASAKNMTSHPIDVSSIIGVSNPSEDDYPCRPYVGVVHSTSRVTIPVGATSVMAVLRMDVINPDMLATPIPWEMTKASNGQYPLLVPVVYGPVGTEIYDCTFMMYLGG